MNKHTPNPWGITCRNGSFRIQPAAKDPAEIEANMRLVRMAPELLEALDALLEQADLGEVDEETKPIVEQARAAIAKARGEA